MQPITFFRDLQRFRQEGLLFTLCYILFARIELLFCYGGLIALCVAFRGDPRLLILVCLVGVVLTLLLFINFTVQLLTPVFFGPFVIGRLKDVTRFRGRVTYGFELLPSGEEVDAGGMDLALALGTVERTYLLLQHPADASVVLPLIDDNPAYLTRILGFADSDRRDLILRQIAFFRTQKA